MLTNTTIKPIARRSIALDFMSTSQMGANKTIEDIEAHLLASTKSALDELVWWSHATMAAKAAEASSRREPNELAA